MSPPAVHCPPRLGQAVTHLGTRHSPQPSSAAALDLLGPKSCSPESFSIDGREKYEALQAILSKQLGPEFISTRAGAGGCKLYYIEGWRVIALANEIFGFDGWSSETKSIEVDFVDTAPDGRISVGVSAVVKITLSSGSSHEDVGYGKIENGKSKADALDKCKKEAVTDALKRTLRMFGNLMGNCLYDKAYLENIRNMRVQKEKFMPSKLYRSEHLDTDRSSAAVKSISRHSTEPVSPEDFSKGNVKAEPAHGLPKPPVQAPLIKRDPVVQRGDTFPPPPVLPVPEKRKCVKECGSDGPGPVGNEFLPPPPTYSDNYFDLDENDLAQLDEAENSEMAAQRTGDASLSENSGLITEASIQGAGSLHEAQCWKSISRPVHDKFALAERNNQSDPRPPIFSAPKTPSVCSSNTPSVDRSSGALYKSGLKSSNSGLSRYNTFAPSQAGHLSSIRGARVHPVAKQPLAPRTNAQLAFEESASHKLDLCNVTASYCESRAAKASTSLMPSSRNVGAPQGVQKPLAGFQAGSVQSNYSHSHAGTASKRIRTAEPS